MADRKPDGELTRREFIELTAKGVAVAAVGMTLGGSLMTNSEANAAAASQTKKPNILFISSDYQAWEDSPDISKFLDMPALNRLCKEGRVLTNHYSSAPICMPARYCLITGQYPHTHGQIGNHDKWIPDSSPILMQELKKAGYNTVGVGKMHFYPTERMAGFDKRIVAEGKEFRWYDDDFAKYLKANGVNSNRVYKEQGPDEIPRVYDYPLDEKLHIDYFVGEQAKGLIDREELTGPWFMWVSFPGPHTPWDPPAKYGAPYKKMDLPKARFRPGELNTKPAIHTYERYTYTSYITDIWDEHPERRNDIVQQIRAYHYGSLTFIDRQVSKILKSLEAKGELENTIVIWTSDHGSHLGDHDLIHKSNHLERSAHVPFVLRYPKAFKPGRVEGLSAHVDLMPTLLTLAGAEVPKACEGKDLSPMLTGSKDSVADEVYTEILSDVSIITKDWKLSVPTFSYEKTAHPIMLGDLYDRRKDPDEFSNLFEDPKHVTVKNELIDKIVAWHSAYANKIERNPRPRPAEPAELKLEQGEMVDMNSDKEPIHQCGKQVNISCRIEPDGDVPLEGTIINHQPWPHSYHLYIKDGRLAFKLKLWKTETLMQAEQTVPAESFDLKATIRKNGEMRLEVDGKVVGGGKAGGCIPVHPGQPIRSTAGSTAAGHEVGGENKGRFTGKIRNLLVKLA